jgi:hypothetical protein
MWSPPKDLSFFVSPVTYTIESIRYDSASNKAILTYLGIREVVLSLQGAPQEVLAFFQQYQMPTINNKVSGFYNTMSFKVGDIVKFSGDRNDFGMVIDVGVNWVSAVLNGGSTESSAKTNFRPAPKDISIFKVWLNTKEVVATKMNSSELNTLSMEWRREIKRNRESATTDNLPDLPEYLPKLRY